MLGEAGGGSVAGIVDHEPACVDRQVLAYPNTFLIVAGILGHSLAILMTTYSHYIPGTQDEAARVMDDILTPIQIDLAVLGK